MPIDAFETIKTIGSLIAIPAGIFLLVDRVLCHRPIAYFQASDDAEYLRLVVVNTALETIVVDGIDCTPPPQWVSFSDDLRDLMGDESFDRIAVLGPDARKEFTWAPRLEWDALAEDDKVRITIRWWFTNSRWLPRRSITVRSTVGRMNVVRRSAPTAD